MLCAWAAWVVFSNYTSVVWNTIWIHIKSNKQMNERGMTFSNLKWRSTNVIQWFIASYKLISEGKFENRVLKLWPVKCRSNSSLIHSKRKIEKGTWKNGKFFGNGGLSWKWETQAVMHQFFPRLQRFSCIINICNNKWNLPSHDALRAHSG